MDVRQNLMQFKMQLLRFMPFYGDILMRLPLKESTDIPTAATDGHTILYNPAFMSTLAPGEQNFVIMHEVFHVLLQHARRNTGSNREHKLWNTACDMVINNMLVQQMTNRILSGGIHFSFPKNGVYAHLPMDTSAEAIYARLLRDNQNNTELTHVELWPDTSTRRYSKPVVVPTVSDLLPASSDALFDRHLQSAIRTALAQHEKEQRGDGPSFYVPPEVFARFAARPLDWRRILWGMLDHQISEDTSYATPERKYLHMDLILPGHSASEETLEEVWIFIDSSGSIPRKTMAAFLTQAHHILRSFNCTMNIAYWDTSVTDVYRNIRTEKQLEDCLPHHSGGTSVNCVYRWLKENHVRPGVMIILTDGYFGGLVEETLARSLRSRTVLLLSTNIRENDTMKKIGRIARLTE